jgi:YHS domain-containing protein
MTSARQAGKLSVASALVALALILAIPGAWAGVATTEWVVIDWRTGLAINGFDPVAYFTDAAAAVGHADLEYTYAGATWRFRNRGNQAAFVAHPEIYMPRLGGHDPVQAARGLGVAGNPELWLIVADRLYLFYDDENRAAFAADPGRYIVEAERKWPAVLRTLTP